MIFDGASLSAFVLCIFVSLNGVSALPSPFDYPDVVPGPGLPSLVSLGLTSKDLYEGKVEISKRELIPRWERICYDNGCGRVPPSDAQACINYLRNLDTQGCGFSGDNVVFCTAGQAVIGGSNIRGGGPISSYCRDVAFGAQSVNDNCVDGNGLVAGADAAWGNGDLIVSIERCG